MFLGHNRYGKAFLYRDSTSYGKQEAMGLAVKLSGYPFGRAAWRHLQIGMHTPAQQIGRGCWTFEVLTWITAPEEKRARQTVKAFVRLKVGLGGRRSLLPEEG